VLEIIAPVGSVESGAVVAPVVVVKNFGTEDADATVYFYISDGYEDEAGVVLEPGEVDTVEFVDWDALTLGTFVVRCTVDLVGDENPANDQLVDSVTVSPVTGAEEGRTARPVFALAKTLPNPFNRATAVRYSLARPGMVDLSVYNAAGTLVRKLVASPAEAGWHTATWNGRDNDGRLVSAGLYILRLEAGDRTATQKLVLQR